MLVTENVLEAGVAPPVVKEKASVLGLRVMLGLEGGAAVTVRVTGTLCGELEAPVEVTVTVPL